MGRFWGVAAITRKNPKNKRRRWHKAEGDILKNMVNALVKSAQKRIYSLRVCREIGKEYDV